jgi:hypothetical protein
MALAFTEPADYSELCDGARLNVDGCLDTVERCRKRLLEIST